MVCHDRRMTEAIGDASSAGLPETTDAIALPTAWNRSELERLGFTGFTPLVGMDRSLLPRRHGVYVVLYESDKRPAFLASNVITKRMPYDPVHLEGKWLMGASVVYIGKAEGREGLHTRVGAFSRQAENHSGGRALWQLDIASDLWWRGWRHRACRRSRSSSPTCRLSRLSTAATRSPTGGADHGP
jgi:hypothetical protein